MAEIKPVWWAWCKERRGRDPYGEIYYAHQVRQPAILGAYWGTGSTTEEAYSNLLEDLAGWHEETSS